MSRIAPTVLVACLLAVTAAAFAYAQRAKLEESPIQSTRFDRRILSPVCTACQPNARQAPIGFRLRNEDQVSVDIVDESGAAVRENLFSGRYTPRSLRFSWDGRDEQGQVVADGMYRVRVSLEDEGRTLEFPDEIRVDATPPTIEDVDVRPRVISPDGDKRSDRATIRYQFGEEAYAILYVDGKRQAGRSFRKRPSGTLQWYALGRRPDTYGLALAAQDLAGNTSSTREFPVRVRFVELARSRFRVRPTAMFRVRVSTDATRLTYRLAGRTISVGSSRSIRWMWVRAPATPGRYRLTVQVGGRRAQATVVVLRARR